EAYLQAQCQRYEQRHGRAPRQAHHLFNRGITLFLRLVHGHWPPPTLPTSPQACFQQQVCEGYAQWLARCRGLAPRTIAIRHARQDRTPIGLRNYAVLLLLATYGLRAGEVVRLRLEDIDWRNECFHVRQSKTGRATVLPLLAPVGEAILDYLREGRPTTEAR